MATIILLDAGLVGLACVDPQKPIAVAFDMWLRGIIGPTIIVRIAEVTRYEVRRELSRLGAVARLRRLEKFCARIPVVPVTPDAWLRAGDFWAVVRRQGRPTAAPDAPDADAILAGVAATIGGPEDRVVIATTNVRHLRWFPGIDARDWRDILPGEPEV